MIPGGVSQQYKKVWIGVFQEFGGLFAQQAFPILLLFSILEAKLVFFSSFLALPAHMPSAPAAPYPTSPSISHLFQPADTAPQKPHAAPTVHDKPPNAHPGRAQDLETPPAEGTAVAVRGRRKHLGGQSKPPRLEMMGRGMHSFICFVFNLQA